MSKKLLVLAVVMASVRPRLRSKLNLTPSPWSTLLLTPSEPELGRSVALAACKGRHRSEETTFLIFSHSQL